MRQISQKFFSFSQAKDLFLKINEIKCPVNKIIIWEFVKKILYRVLIITNLKFSRIKSSKLFKFKNIYFVLVSKIILLIFIPFWEISCVKFHISAEIFVFIKVTHFTRYCELAKFALFCMEYKWPSSIQH